MSSRNCTRRQERLRKRKRKQEKKAQEVEESDFLSCRFDSAEIGPRKNGKSNNFSHKWADQALFKVTRADFEKPHQHEGTKSFTRNLDFISFEVPLHHAKTN